MSDANKDDLLRAIDDKLGALLALATDKRLGEDRPPEARSLDVLLVGAGISTAEAATLLGKSQRAVQKAIAGPRPKARPGKPARG